MTVVGWQVGNFYISANTSGKSAFVLLQDSTFGKTNRAVEFVSHSQSVNWQQTISHNFDTCGVVGSSTNTQSHINQSNIAS